MKGSYVMAVLIAASLSSGCAAFAPPPRATYLIPLESVRRPADTATRWGAYTISPADSSGYRYSDELVSILVAPARGTIGLSIENLTEHSLQVLWNEASFVGVDGLASRVVPGTTLVMDMEREQSPTVVPAKSRIVTSAIPNEYYSRSSYGTTIRDFVCVGVPYSDIDGKEARLILPLRVLDVTNEYTFVFRVTDIVPPPRPAQPSASFPDRSESC